MSPTKAQKFGERVRQSLRPTLRKSQGRNGRPLPETPFSAFYRERAEQKRARRRERRLTVDRFGYCAAPQPSETGAERT